VRILQVILKAGAPAYGGLTIGRITQEPTAETGGLKAKVVLIRGAIPGEMVEVSIDDEKKDYYLASVKKVIEPSPDRIEPGPCPGCQLHYISYDRQVVIKEEVLSDALRRIGGINIELSEPLTLKGNTWGYRFRGQFKVSDGKIGFYKEKTREIIDLDYSPLMIDEINEVLKKVHGAVHSQPEKFQSVTEIHISYGDGAFAFVRTNPKAKKERLFWDELAALLLSLGFKGTVIEADGRRLLKYGRGFLSLPLDDMTYTVSPMGFFQSNWKLNQVLVRFIKDHLQPLGGKKVLDLFSGAGNFTLPLALDAGEVVAVEENPFAIEDGKRNLQLNKIDNLQFLRSAAEAFNIKYYGPDIVILDPPRAGVSDRLIGNLLKAAPQKIVYVSCNPSTLARDLKRLTDKYEVESVRLVDLFPQTYHIEALAFLK